MFQPGEEGFHGARRMIEDGLLALVARCDIPGERLELVERGSLAGGKRRRLLGADADMDQRRSWPA